MTRRLIIEQTEIRSETFRTRFDLLIDDPPSDRLHDGTAGRAPRDAGSWTRRPKDFERNRWKVVALRAMPVPGLDAPANLGETEHNR